MFSIQRRKKGALTSALKHNMQQQRWLLFTISMLVYCCLWAQPPAASIAPGTASQTDIVIAGPFSNETDTTASGLLPANSHWISFHITCGSCNDSPHTMLEYRLNTPAYNSNWAALPKTGKIVFQQLKSGKYLLQVRNQTAILPAAVAVFEVDKIWYRKTFWLVILVITAALILYLFFKLYHSRLLHKKNELEEKVLERTSELLQSNQALKEKINELDIIRANLTKTNRLSEQLISILSHDVHSPLRFSTMVGKAVLTKQQDLNKEEIIDALNDINQTGVRILLLISNLLKWMEYQKEHVAPQLLKENLRQMVQDKIEFFRFMAESKNIEFINNIPEDIFITTEKTAFGIIIQNLLNNAVKFTPDGEIEVNAGITADGIEINIIDTGMGIPAGSIEAIKNGELITPLTDTDKMKGNGIGWSVIKELLYHLNGSFDIKSGEGLGTAITLRFPVI